MAIQTKDSRTLRNWRSVLGITIAITTLLKLYIAAHTDGTNDVRYWTEFAEGVRDFGPIGIYGHSFDAQYNHPPLAGWLLAAINQITDLGISNFSFLIRMPATFADIVTVFLVFELVRRLRPTKEAGIAGLLIATSPALIVISGFHGNTDPVFIMLTLLATYLLITERSPFWVGVCLALAVSVKLVPIVVIPAILIVLFRQGRQAVQKFAVGGGAVAILLWLPVIVTRWQEFKENSLSYQGVLLNEWGVVQFARWAGAPDGALDLLMGPGRFIVLIICAGIPAMLVWRHPRMLAPAVGLAFSLFLLFGTAFGMQYLIWPLAAAYFINMWAASVYNATASLLILLVYSHWNSAWPGNWDTAIAGPFRTQDFFLMVVTWEALAVVVLLGMRLLRKPDFDTRFLAKILQKSSSQIPSQETKETLGTHS